MLFLFFYFLLWHLWTMVDVWLMRKNGVGMNNNQDPALENLGPDL
jgi:hypothetical protein